VEVTRPSWRTKIFWQLTAGGGLVGDHDDEHGMLAWRSRPGVARVGAGGGIEVAGGFVGEEDLGGKEQGAGDGDPLLLASGEGVGAVVGSPVESEALE